MCGRYAFQPNKDMLQALAEDQHQSFETGDIIVPNMDILFYRKEGMDIAKWGFKPDWADEGFKASTHNARSETLHEKAMYRGEWEKGQRCIIPANYFFEWQHGTKLGFTVHPTHSEFLYFAGLWQENAHGLRVTIITKASGSNTVEIHRRMPVMLERKDLPLWLKGSYQNSLSLIHQANDNDLEIKPLPSTKKQQSFI